MRFVVLDGLRGVAALIVVLLHTVSVFSPGRDLPNAGLAVDFFFCLSGFVIAAAYDGRGLTAPAFLWRRFARLYPMVFVGSVAGFLAAGADHPGYLAASLALLPVAGVLAYPLDFPLWSLFFEAIANLGYAAGGRASKRIMVIAAGLSGLLLLALIAKAGHLFGTGGRYFALGTVRVAYPFLAGMLVYRLRLWRGAPRFPAWILGLALAACLLAPPLMWAFQAGFVLIGAPLIVALGANAVTRWAPIHEEAGRLSYPLYLIHAPAIAAVSTVLGRTPYAPFVGFVAAIAAAYVALLLFDEPARRALAGHRRPVVT